MITLHCINGKLVIKLEISFHLTVVANNIHCTVSSTPGSCVFSYLCRVAHSLNAITSKPQTKAQEQLTKDIDEAMKKYKDVEHLIKDAAGANTRGQSPHSEI